MYLNFLCMVHLQTFLLMCVWQAAFIFSVAVQANGRAITLMASECWHPCILDGSLNSPHQLQWVSKRSKQKQGVILTADVIPSSISSVVLCVACVPRLLRAQTWQKVSSLLGSWQLVVLIMDRDAGWFAFTVCCHPARSWQVDLYSTRCWAMNSWVCVWSEQNRFTFGFAVISVHIIQQHSTSSAVVTEFRLFIFNVC